MAVFPASMPQGSANKPVSPVRQLCHAGAVLVACALLLCASFTEAAQRVRVGYCPLEGFFAVDAQGQFSGYGYEYLEELAGEAGWELEFVPVAQGEEDALLRSGAIDVFGPRVRHGANDKANNFPLLNAGVLWTELLAREDDARFVLGQLPAQLSVGILAASHGKDEWLAHEDGSEKALDAWAEQAGITIHTRVFQTVEAMRTAFFSGAVDTMLGSSLHKHEHVNILARFAARPFYFVPAPARADILQAINAVQAEHAYADPYFTARLREKHYRYNVAHPVTFSRAERAALSAHPSLRVIFLNALPPLSSGGGGEFNGIAVDVFKHIAQITGTRFERLEAGSMGAALDMLRHEKADVICLFDYDYSFAREQGLRVSTPYVSIPIIRVLRKNTVLPDEGPVRVALPRIFLEFPSLAHSVQNERYLPLYFQNVEQCLDAVLDGTADMTLAPLYRANVLLAAERYLGLMPGRVEGQPWDISLAVSRRLEAPLLSAFGKVVSSMPASRINSIISLNTLEAPETNWRDLLYRYPGRIMAGALALLALCAGVLLYIDRLQSRSSRKIRQVLYYDELTHLLNLPKFREESTRLLREDSGREHALLYVNINNFKYINVTYGFAVGDRVLRGTADVLRQCLTAGELAGKSSADRFLLLLRLQTQDELPGRIRALDTALSGIADTLKLQSPLVFNCGICLCASMDDVAAVIDRAHYARETLPPSAYNGYAFYDEKIIARLDFEKEIESMMVSSLERGEFIAYFQPKVDMQTREIIGAEALVRWRHPHRGLMPPGRYIPLFEKNGFIIDLDMVMYEQVCRTVHEMMEAGEKTVPVSCNFSRRHFTQPHFARTLLAIAEKHKVPLALLELEITESAVAENMEHMLVQLRELKKLGFTISIDDFGAGYSSLGLLPRLDADVLKLDKLFLEEQMSTERSRCVIHGLVKIAEQLRLQVICEGVETEVQARYLMRAGCRYCQGFLFGRPMPAAQFRTLLAARYV